MEILRRLKDVKNQTGLSRSGIYDLEKHGKFPQRVQIGPRAVAWRSSEIDEWIESRPRAVETAS